MSLVLKAHEFAAKAHAGVFRKFTGEPYFEHPKRVAARLAALGFPATVVAAAVLHDVVEDCGVRPSELATAFGPEVAALVLEVTKPVMCKASTTRAERKAAFRAHLAKSSYFGASIKLSDEEDNSRNVAEVNPEFAAVCLPELREELKVLGHGHPELLASVAANIFNYFSRPS
jgi:(p)ppGpp synthase/HD superfamily hydrolase